MHVGKHIDIHAGGLWRCKGAGTGVGSGMCSIERQTRIHCKLCRWKACLGAGMRPEFVHNSDAAAAAIRSQGVLSRSVLAEIAAPTDMMRAPEAAPASIAARAPPEIPEIPPERPPTVKAEPQSEDVAEPTNDIKEHPMPQLNPAAGCCSAAAVAEAKPPAPAAAMPSSPIHHNKNHHTSVRKRMLAHLDHVYRTWVVATRVAIH